MSRVEGLSLVSRLLPLPDRPSDFLSYWTKVQYTDFSLYAKNNERRVTREDLLRTLYSILFPRHPLLVLVYVGNGMVRIKGRGIFALLMIVFLLAPLSSQAAESPQSSTQRASEEELVNRPRINTQLQAFGNVAKPEFGSDWQLRFQVQLLFPK